MDVSFGTLRPARFVERLSRFHALVEVDRRRCEAHVPNSGRLRELFVHGAQLRVREVDRPGRRTRFDVVLARTGSVWACIDSRLPPRLVAAASDRIGALRGLEAVRTEPPLGSGRADLLFSGDVVCETKSITLVRAGAGLFPDSPSTRGAKHARALARDRRRGLIVFVCQRPDADAVRVNAPADPEFARAVRKGVETAAVTCRVTERGISVDREVPVEAYSPDAAVETLPDHLRDGLRLVVCGLNPGHYAAFFGGYYARPGNRFWPLARRAGLVPATTGPGDEEYLCRTRGIGFTDLVKRPTRAASSLTADEWRAGAERLRGLVRRYRPGGLAVVGLRAARELGLDPAPGPGGELEGVRTFVLPSTSGRQAAYPARELSRLFHELAGWV